MSRTLHPLLRRKSYGYGCSCGCASCGDTSPSYGAGITTDKASRLTWEYDTAMLESCPEFKDAVEKYEKAKANYYKLPSVFGVRTGAKVAQTTQNMDKFKAKGEAAYRACVGKEEAAGPATQALSSEDVLKAVSGGGTDQTGEESNALVYVLGASVLAVGGFVVYAIVKKNKQKKGAA